MQPLKYNKLVDKKRPDSKAAAQPFGRTATLHIYFVIAPQLNACLVVFPKFFTLLQSPNIYRVFHLHTRRQVISYHRLSRHDKTRQKRHSSVYGQQT